jgi:hypothetical protein
MACSIQEMYPNRNKVGERLHVRLSIADVAKRNGMSHYAC